MYGSVFGHAVDYVIKGRKSRSDKDGDARVQAGFYLVLKVSFPAKAPTNDWEYFRRVARFLLVWPAKSFIFSEQTRHYFRPIDFSFRGLLFIWQTVANREILCSLPIICSRFAENIIYISRLAGQSFASSCARRTSAGAQNFSAPTEMNKIYRQGRTTLAIIILTISVVVGGVWRSGAHLRCRLLTVIPRRTCDLIKTSAFAETAAAAHAGCSHDSASTLLVAQHARAEHVLCAFARLEKERASVRLLSVYRAKINHALRETNLQITQSRA